MTYNLIRSWGWRAASVTYNPINLGAKELPHWLTIRQDPKAQQPLWWATTRYNHGDKNMPRWPTIRYGRRAKKPLELCQRSVYSYWTSNYLFWQHTEYLITYFDSIFMSYFSFWQYTERFKIHFDNTLTLRIQEARKDHFSDYTPYLYRLSAFWFVVWHSPLRPFPLLPIIDFQSDPSWYVLTWIFFFDNGSTWALKLRPKRERNSPLKLTIKEENKGKNEERMNI